MFSKTTPAVILSAILISSLSGITIAFAANAEGDAGFIMANLQQEGDTGF